MAADRLQPVRLSGRGPEPGRPRARRAHDPAGARSHPARCRLDPAGHGHHVPGLCTPRPAPGYGRPFADRPSRLSARPSDRDALHDARGDLRRPARRRRHLHRPVHDLRRGAGVLRRRAVFHRLVDGGDGEVPLGGRAGPHRDAGGLSARHGLGQRRRHDRDARLGVMAAPAAGRLQTGNRRRDSLGRRNRRAAVAAHAGRRRLPDRGVPADLLPARSRHGDDPDHPLLPLDLPDDRGGCAARRHPTRSRRDSRRVGADKTLRLSLHVAVWRSRS